MGVDVVRGLKGVADNVRHDTAGGVVVTSTTFSADAQKEAGASGWTIALMDRGDLLELMENAERLRP
ncbi:restriction endonuclease [Sphingomonas sp. Root710]|uniref:restriction endonuclease n=1 Tax=Sphingomonas sp. Root710 TaxID=1736594 RepID=UPI0026A6F21D